MVKNLVISQEILYNDDKRGARKMLENVVKYLSEQSGIPVWMFDEECRMLFSTFEKDRLVDTDKLQSFFSHFTETATQTPQISRLEGGGLYGTIKTVCDGKTCFLIAGPSYEVHPLSRRSKKFVSIYFLIRSDKVHAELLKMPVVSLNGFCRFIAVLGELFNGKEYDVQRLGAEISERSIATFIDRQLTEVIFNAREEEQETVYAPEEEKRLLSYVTNGDVEAVRRFRLPTVKAPTAEGNQNQILFEAVTIVALATRAAIEGGVDYVDAYSMSDLYFKRLGNGFSKAEAAPFITEVLVHFAQKVREAGNTGEMQSSYSPYITRSIQYIRAHLHYPLSLEDVANELNINPKYLSRLFVNHLGEKFSAFVQRERVMEAKNLLDNINQERLALYYEKNGGTLMRDLKEIIARLTLEEKAGLCSGLDFWHTKGVERLGVPSVMVSDGPHGLRKQEEGADHLGIHDSIQAVCFPAACATSASFDRFYYIKWEKRSAMNVQRKTLPCCSVLP